MIDLIFPLHIFYVIITLNKVTILRRRVTMTEERKILNIAEKRVKEWIDYTKKEYDWEDAQYDLFEEPMFELCVQVATLAIKELKDNDVKKLKEQTDNIKNVLTRLIDTVVHADNIEEAGQWITLKRDAEFILKELDK